MQKIKMKGSEKSTQPSLGNFFAQHRPTPKQETAPKPKIIPESTVSFYLTTINDGGCSKKMLTVIPKFHELPSSYTYEISGSEGFLLEGSNNISKSSTKEIIISFYCKTGQTYFTKIIAYYLNGFKDGQPQFNTQEFRFFYKVRDDFDSDEETGESEESEDIEVKKTGEEDSDNDTVVTEVEDTEADGEAESEIIEASDEYLENIRQVLDKHPQSGLDLGSDEE